MKSDIAQVVTLLANLMLPFATPLVVTDTLILTPQDPRQPGIAHVVFTNASRLVVDKASELRHVSILNAPRVREIEGTGDLQILLIHGCLLERLQDSLAQLSSVTILKLMFCQLKGTFDLALLFATRTLVSLNLEGNQLERLALSRPQDPGEQPVLEHLDLSHNGLEHLDWSVLQPFTKLNVLLLSYNRLVSLSGEVRLPSLGYLSLQQNRLIHADLRGCDCAALDQVQLARNELTSWPTFAPSSAAVRTLELSSNHLSAVNFTELAQLRSLISLQLDRNAIGSLEPCDEGGHVAQEMLVEMPRLEGLFLDDNQLERVELDRWKMPLLQSLKVQFNPLKSLPSDLFVRWPMLKFFYCFCSEVDCEWVEQNASYLTRATVQMSVYRAQENTKDPLNTKHCVTVPSLGCVLCSPRS